MSNNLSESSNDVFLRRLKLYITFLEEINCPKSNMDFMAQNILKYVPKEIVSNSFFYMIPNINFLKFKLDFKLFSLFGFYNYTTESLLVCKKENHVMVCSVYYLLHNSCSEFYLDLKDNCEVIGMSESIYGNNTNNYEFKGYSTNILPSKWNPEWIFEEELFRFSVTDEGYIYFIPK